MDMVGGKPHVPVSRDASQWVRKIKSAPTLNDLVEALHMELVDSEGELGERYNEFLNATRDSQAVEGSLSYDDAMAAAMIRTLAKEKNNPVANEKLAVIAQSLRVVLKRYGEGRKDRRYRVGGKTVQADSNGNGDE